MTTFVYIENGKILERYQELPRSWRNISGFNHLASDIEKLNILGWYRVQNNHQSYDPEKFRVTGTQLEIQNSQVVETLILAPLTEADILERHLRRREEFLEDLRSERNQRLRDSDWTQALDVNLSFSTELREAWKNYRQNLRDLTAQYESLPDYQNIEITWPNKPQ